MGIPKFCQALIQMVNCLPFDKDEITSWFSYLRHNNSLTDGHPNIQQELISFVHHHGSSRKKY